jgi:hypothetical protein
MSRRILSAWCDGRRDIFKGVDSMVLESIISVVRLLELCALTINNENVILIIHQGDAVRQNPTRIECIWRIFRPLEGSAQVIWEKRCFVPPARKTSSILHGATLITAMESNTDNAVYIVELPFSISDTSQSCEPLTAPLNATAPATIGIDKIWSTAGGDVTPQESLFDPSTGITNKNEKIVFATTADIITHAYMLSANDSVQEKASLSHCARPVYANCSSTECVISQVADDSWSPFYFSTFSKIPSILMPLRITYFDAAYAISETIDISKGDITGPSFIFDACIADNDRLVLATVGNTVKKPILQVLVSSRAGKLWREAGSIELTIIPRRLAVAAHGDEALIGLTFDLEEVRTAQFSID